MQASIIASSRLGTYLPCGKDRTNASRDRFVAEARKDVEAVAAVVAAAAATANIGGEGGREEGATRAYPPPFC